MRTTACACALSFESDLARRWWGQKAAVTQRGIEEMERWLLPELEVRKGNGRSGKMVNTIAGPLGGMSPLARESVRGFAGN